jgi:hypothetical protein
LRLSELLDVYLQRFFRAVYIDQHDAFAHWQRFLQWVIPIVFASSAKTAHGASAAARGVRSGKPLSLQISSIPRHKTMRRRRFTLAAFYDDVFVGHRLFLKKRQFLKRFRDGSDSSPTVD